MHTHNGKQLSPYLTMLVFSVLGGVWYSWLISTCDFSKSSASKIVTGVGLFGALVAFLSMTTTTTAAGGTCVTSGVLASLALSRGGWSTNHAEICAPEHGPMLFSVANCVSSITSVVGITITGAMLDNFGGADDVDAWKVAMGVIGGLCGVSGLFYAVFAAGNEVLFPAIGGSYGCDVSGADNENLDVGSSGDGQKARGEKRTLRQDEVIASRTVDGSRPILSNAGHENLKPV